MYAEEDLLPLSALQHLVFCERQCALIHVEGLWAENRLTMEGKHLHRKVDEGPDERRGGVRTVRGLPVRSLRLGLVGKADAVEFHSRVLGGDAGPAWERVIPVEYKRGKPKRDDSDRIQLCAQALCLEEMLGLAIPLGAIFYRTTRRRLEVELDNELRDRTEKAAGRLHTLIASGTTPRAVREPKCDGCSLLHLCLPDALGPRRSAAGFLTRALGASLETVE